MINSLCKVIRHVSPNDENAFVLRIENNDLKILKDSFKYHKAIRDNVDFLEEMEVYPDKFIIIDMHPIVLDDSKNTYYYKLYCCGNNKLDSKMDILNLFLKNFTGVEDNGRTILQSVSRQIQITKIILYPYHNG